MEINTIYNTPITIEEGDFISYDQKSYLWIRSGERLYKSTHPFKDKDSIPREIIVNSVEFLLKDKEYYDELDWKEYR